MVDQNKIEMRVALFQCKYGILIAVHYEHHHIMIEGCSLKYKPYEFTKVIILFSLRTSNLEKTSKTKFYNNQPKELHKKVKQGLNFLKKKKILKKIIKFQKKYLLPLRKIR